MADFCVTVSRGTGEGISGFQEAQTLVILHNIAQVIATAVVSFADTHRVVREVDIAVIAWIEVSQLLRAWESFGKKSLSR